MHGTMRYSLLIRVCQNLITLAPHAHADWERAYFVLEPIRISDDEKRLDVKFFWLASNPHVPRVDILQVPSLAAAEHGPNLARLFNHETVTQSALEMKYLLKPTTQSHDRSPTSGSWRCNGFCTA